MKRIALLLTAVAVLALSTTNFANAADYGYGHGYVGHSTPSHGQVTYGHVNQQSYLGHGYATPTYSYGEHGSAAPVNGHGVVQYGNAGHGYAQQAYAGHRYAARGHGGYVYPSYGHGGGVSVSTPNFGLRIGH